MTEREKGLRLALIEVAAELAEREEIIAELRAKVASQAATIEAYREQRGTGGGARIDHAWRDDVAALEDEPTTSTKPTEPAPPPVPQVYGVRLKKSGRDLKQGDSVAFKDGVKWNFESVDPQTLSVVLSNSTGTLTMTLSDFYVAVLDE